MGSDLHMSPPSPDEYRIVRSGNVTAVYSRHTDGIYGDTRTWTRLHFIEDPDGIALKTLRATHGGWPVVTVSDEFDFPETMEHLLLTPDRDWDKEERELDRKVVRAEERAAAAWDDVIAAKIERERFHEERRRDGA